ncbi:transporter substrate-binding domain-containing protein [Rhodocyclaceae bacterium SMB388]
MMTPPGSGRRKGWLAVITIWLAAAALPAGAQLASTDTLQRIKERGTITLGHRESSVPFAYYDDKGQVIGYSHELALKIVDAVRRHLDEPLLVLRLVPVTPETRIDMIRRGDIDLECGSTTHNSQRARQVSFSNTFFIVGTRMLTRRDSGIHDFADLPGRTVVTTAGTTSEKLLSAMNERQQGGIEIVTAPDHRESFMMLERDEAEAFMMDDALLYGELAKAASPEQWIVTGTPQSYEAYGCMMRRGDLAFKRLVDATLARVMTSGEAERIYRKWFMSPLPPSGLNLNYPLSETMRALFLNPNDNPFQ